MKKMITDLFRGLSLTMAQIAGDTKAILVSVGDDVEYVGEKPTGKRLGTKYTIVCPKAKYAQITVKVPDAAPLVTQEVLDTAADPVWVSFEDFVGRLYTMRDEVGLTCRATKAVLVQSGGKAHEKTV